MKPIVLQNVKNENGVTETSDDVGAVFLGGPYEDRIVFSCCVGSGQGDRGMLTMGDDALLISRERHPAVGVVGEDVAQIDRVGFRRRPRRLANPCCVMPC